MLRFFDEKKRESVLQMLRLGLSRRSAAQCVGCHVQTIYNEMARCSTFRAEVMQAESGFESRHRARVEKASEEAARWRASAWALERKFPDEYMPRLPNTISPAQVERMLGQFAEVLIAEIPDEGLRKRVTDALWKIIDQSQIVPEQE
jgi:IS30 family transposase